jgi:hypothetical protein
MTLPGKTEAGSAGMQPCRGIAWWAHRDDVHGRGSFPFALFPKHIGSKDPYALKIPAQRAEYLLTESELSPFHAEPAQFAHGFSYAVAGAAIKTINFPGANQTFIFGVNNHGTITGRYTDTGGVQHGIARIFGQWASYDFPGASNFTTLEYVNDNNVATGFYVDKVGLTHGFTVQIALSQAN